MRYPWREYYNPEKRREYMRNYMRRWRARRSGKRPEGWLHDDVLQLKWE